MTIDELRVLLEAQGLDVVVRKNQEVSQEYEWNFCKENLEDEKWVMEYLSVVERQDVRSSHIFSEFCGKSEHLLEELAFHTSGKVMLEIGSSWAPQISLLPARKRICIEPLADKIEAFCLKKYSKSIFGNIKTYSQYADKYIPELASSVDGLIYIRNCIDHSPNWMYILSNLSSYARKDCKLLIWNDTHHADEHVDRGHYTVAPSISAFVRLIENLGFAIERKFDFHDRGMPNVGLVATKIFNLNHSDSMEYRISEGAGRDVHLREEI